MVVRLVCGGAMGAMHISKGIFSLHVRRALAAKSWRYALLLSLTIVAASFVQLCLNFWGYDAAELPSASVAWVGNHGYMKTPLFGLWIFMLMFPLLSAVYGDAFYVHRRDGLIAALVTRTSKARYLLSGGCVAFLGAFLVALGVLLVSQLISFIAFPVDAGRDAFALSFNSPSSDVNQWGAWSDSLLFSELYLGNRYLYNLLFCIYDAVWAGLMALASYVLSCYVKRSRVVTLGVPTLVYLALSNFLPLEINLSSYVGLVVSWTPGGSVTFFALAPLVFLALLVAALALPLVLKRDVLL